MGNLQKLGQKKVLVVKNEDRSVIVVTALRRSISFQSKKKKLLTKKL